MLEFYEIIVAKGTGAGHVTSTGGSTICLLWRCLPPFSTVLVFALLFAIAVLVTAATAAAGWQPVHFGWPRLSHRPPCCGPLVEGLQREDLGRQEPQPPGAAPLEQFRAVVGNRLLGLRSVELKESAVVRACPVMVRTDQSPGRR